MTMITVDSIFVYLCQQENWISDVQIAAELESSMPVTRKLLAELGDVVENDGDGNWRIIKTTSVEIVSETISELTIDEESELLRLERRIERGFYIAGAALKDIRDRRLYRHRYKTFEEYCQARFSFSRRNADYLIASVSVVDNLLTSVSEKMRNTVSQKSTSVSEKMRNTVSQKYLFLPNSLRQTIPLSKLTPIQQHKAWEKALSISNNSKPSGKLVSQVVEQMQHQEKMDNYLDNEQEHVQSKTSSNKRSEGLNYQQGLGCEWNVKVDRSTYEELKDYQIRMGLPTLNSAIANLLEKIEKKR